MIPFIFSTVPFSISLTSLSKNHLAKNIEALQVFIWQDLQGFALNLVHILQLLLYN